VLRLLKLVLIAVAAFLLLKEFAGETVYIATGSMETTLPTGSRFFLDKLVYRFREPRRGEIVSFSSPVGGPNAVKRIIAVGGDRVELKDKKVYLNGKPLYEPYVQYTRPNEKLAGDTMPETEVPAGMYFVMGDNRDTSFDSATWRDPKTGERIIFLKRGMIEGKIRGAYRKWE